MMTFFGGNFWRTFFWLNKVFCKKSVPKNFAKFTEKHLCQSLIFNKVAGVSLKKIMRMKPESISIKPTSTQEISKSFLKLKHRMKVRFEINQLRKVLNLGTPNLSTLWMPMPYGSVA